MSSFWHTYTQDMAHRHVLLGYAFAWLVQLGYLGLVLRGWRRSKTLPSSDT